MTSTNVIDYHPPKRPLGERINFRMLSIVLVFSLLVGYPIYQFLKSQMSHGIEHVGDRFNVELKRLGNFPFNEMTGTIDNIPPEYRPLDGKKVALEGFQYAPDASGDRIDNFQFVYNISKCCFNGPPLVQERVFAFVPNGKTVEYHYQEEIRVIGTLHLAMVKDHDTGKIVAVYTLDVDHIEPL